MIMRVLYLIIAVLALTGCKTADNAAPVASTPARPATVTAPDAIVYRTSGDYAALVPVTLDNRGEIASYPAVSDIKHSRRPLALAEGYLLDRRGIGLHVAFTSYTYDEYAALPGTPSRAQLRESIVARSPLTAMYRLPMSVAQAEADTAAVNALIRAGFPGCEPLLPALSELE